MTNEELTKGLKQLNLSAMAEGYSEASRAAEKGRLTYEQYLAGLVDEELGSKASKITIEQTNSRV